MVNTKKRKQAAKNIEIILKSMTDVQIRNLMEHAANKTPMLLSSDIKSAYCSIEGGTFKS